MSRLLQRTLAEKIANGEYKKHKTNKKFLESVGYSPKSAATATGRILNTIGVQQELKKLGFNVEAAKAVVAQILEDEEAKHRDRLKAAEEIFKVQGAYAPEKKLNVNVSINANPKAREIAAKYEEELKQNLLNENDNNRDNNNPVSGPALLDNGNSNGNLDNRPMDIIPNGQPQSEANPEGIPGESGSNAN